MMTRSTIRRTAVLLATTLLLVATVAAIALPATAAGQTSIRLVPGTDQLAVQETTTVEIVATNADGGVGAYNATVSLDSEHATITNASVDAQLQRVEISDDGSTAHIAVALLDTPDEGSVTIGTLTIAGAAAGTSSLSVQVNALADEEGRTYEVAGTSGTTVTVTDQSTPGNSGEATSSAAGTPSSEAEADGGGDGSGSTGASAGTEDQAENGAESTLLGGFGGDSPAVMALVGLVVLVAAVAVGLFIGRRY